jgi:glycosyltransferase involved in cell wall biosynthesis
VSDQTKKYKIALIGDCLAKGGAEKVHGLLSIFFSNQGFDVYNCIFIDNVSYEYSGHLLNLGVIKANSPSIVRKYYRFCAFYKFIKVNRLDCIIDLRMRPSFLSEFIFSRFIYPENTIFYVLSGNLNFYFPKKNYLSKWIYQNRKIATVSEAIAGKIKNFDFTPFVRNMFQPFDFQSINDSESEFFIDEKYILVVGNMDSDIKQIDKLIDAYSKSILPELNIKLFILGDGILKESYKNLVQNLKLSTLVEFIGILKNPFPYYKNANFLVLSSKNEGLSNAIIESLACETPVVAFDCFSGPREIITNHQNGILVENQNFDKLTEAINLMVSDQELFLYCKKNAMQSVRKFSIEKIGNQWLEYIKS